MATWPAQVQRTRAISILDWAVDSHQINMKAASSTYVSSRGKANCCIYPKFKEWNNQAVYSPNILFAFVTFLSLFMDYNLVKKKKSIN